jgi:hypothetical protein
MRFLAVLLLVATSACAATPGPATSAVIPDGAPMAAVLAQAAEKSGVPTGQIAVLSAEKVTWRDGSMGCPEAGGMYPQALVPGYRIRLKAGAQSLDFHTDARRGLILLCPSDRSQEPLPAGPG